MPQLDAILDANARVEKVATGFRLTEGPLFSRIGYLLFSDVAASRIFKWAAGQLSLFREHSNQANGLTFDHQGRLLACEKGRVTRTEKDGSITVLAGSRVTPNDLVYAIDGSIYFSDPPAVYQITRRGEVRVATLEIPFPNGVALAPKQLVLYVADSVNRNIRAFDIAGDGALSKGRVVAELPGGADGLKTDEAGNLYAATQGGIQVFSAEGKPLGLIATPEEPSNCNWGAGFRGLYITAQTSVYYVPTGIPGTRTY